MALVEKNPPANAGNLRDTGSIPGSRRSPGGRYGNWLQPSCLEKPMDREAWQPMVHRVTESQTRLSDLVCSITVCLKLTQHCKSAICQWNTFIYFFIEIPCILNIALYACQSQTPNPSLLPTILPGNRKFVLSVCDSVSVLYISSLVTFFVAVV